MVKDDYVKFGGNRDTFEIKATGDKADLHKNLGLFIYGYSLCDKHVQIDHQGADAQRGAASTTMQNAYVATG